MRVGTTLRLELPPLTEGEATDAGLWPAETDATYKPVDNPWAEIKVVAQVDHGGDRGGVELIVQPVTFSNLSSPKAVSADSLEAVGYAVVADGAAPSEWATEAEEIADAG